MATGIFVDNSKQWLGQHPALPSADLFLMTKNGLQLWSSCPVHSPGELWIHC